MGLFGGDSKSKSYSNTTVKTTTIDNRSVADADSIAFGSIGASKGGEVAFAGDGANSGTFGNLTNSTLVMQSSDKDVLFRALDTVDAIAGEGLDKLLKTAGDMFAGGKSLLDQSAAAMQTAANDAKGALDQKTMMVLGALTLGAIYFMTRGR